jgi:transcriptional regulator with XRE-family HTH domain
MHQWTLDEDAAAPFFRQAADRGGRYWIDAFYGTRLAACRQARTDGPASVLDAARQIRTLVVQVSCYESGRTRPRAKAVQALAAVLGVDLLQLLAPGTPVTLVTLRATGADLGRRRCRAGHQPQPLRRRRAG